jgi:hypothetical protein
MDEEHVPYLKEKGSEPVPTSSLRLECTLLYSTISRCNQRSAGQENSIVTSKNLLMCTKKVRAGDTKIEKARPLLYVDAQKAHASNMVSYSIPYDYSDSEVQTR